MRTVEVTAETNAIIGAFRSSGLPGAVTDINTRFNAAGRMVHASGSWHYAPGTPQWAGDHGTAVDFGFLPVGRPNSPELLAIHQWFMARYATVAEEIIYGGNGVSFVVSRGRVIPVNTLPKAIRDAHINHVHVAVRTGVILTFAEPVAPPVKTLEDDLADFTTSACMAPSRLGRWVLDRNGAVRAYHFDDKRRIPMFGSMFDFPKEQAVPGRYFVSIVAAGPHDDDGYFIIANDGFAGLFSKAEQAKRK